ncbi:hypothetical protein CLU79DRAFT_716061 [Phycomyces nitens]|nr:hypothetical protein CLU79DRAFT_716061 [Phycomyces nitens]
MYKEYKEGRSVEDILYNVSKSFTYEHPSHSYIVDLSDGTWKNNMEQEDFEEISSCHDNALNKPLPNYLEEILCKLDKKCNCRAPSQRSRGVLVEAGGYRLRTVIYGPE